MHPGLCTGEWVWRGTARNCENEGMHGEVASAKILAPGVCM